MPEEIDPKVLALAAQLEVDPSDIEENRDVFTCSEAPGEYAVMTEDERETAADQYLENYIDECLLPEMPETARYYFDHEEWKRDAIMSDGYGHTLASYDGHEHEQQIDGVWYFIYRTN